MKIKHVISLFLIGSLLFFACADDEMKDTPGSSIDGIEEVNSANDTEANKVKKEETKKAEISNTQADDFEENETMGSGFMYLMIIMIVIFGLAVPFFFWYFVPLGLWYEARLSGIQPGWWNMTKMRFQDIPQKMIIDTLILAQNAGLRINTRDMMQKYLAGVDVEVVTKTAVRAINAGFEVSYNELASQFLAKVDVETVMHALITARNAELDVTLKELAAHYLANVDVIKVIEALVTAHNAGYDVFTLKDLKEHYLANGDVTKTVDAFIAAKEAHFQDVTFKDIAAIDLSGIDVEKAVHSAVYPIVVETPTVIGVARDGVQLHMKLKLTLRTNLKHVIGGATEQTVLARIDESLSTEIGHAGSHYDILKDPFLLADIVENKNLGEGTAYDILSVDVSEVTVGKDIHAALQAERAKADSETAKAELIRAEEKVKKSMASAFMDGKLSIEQYHQLMNTEADTEMRRELGKAQAKKQQEKNDYVVDDEVINEQDNDDEYEEDFDDADDNDDNN
jgi:uncharacterized protein YqfA (UPF0365 family)